MTVKPRLTIRWGVLAAGLLLMALTACASAPAGTADPTPSAQSLEGWVPQRTADPTQEYFLSLAAEDPIAYLNGAEVTLPIPPRMMDGVLFIPLQEITLLLEGSYAREGDTATVTLAGITAQYTAGRQELTVDGHTYREPEEGAPSSADVPRVVDGVFYVPAVFTGGTRQEYPLNTARQALSGLAVTYGSMELDSELTVNGGCLGCPYGDLPQAQLDSTEEMGTVFSVEGFYRVEGYRWEGLEIYVFRIAQGNPDADGMDGRVVAIHVTGYQYPTARGLVVGDTPYTVCRLYDEEGFTNHFRYHVDNGRVESYTFYTRFYGSTL